MSANVVNTVPYLRTSWEFPEDPKLLSVEVSRSYLSIANAVNNRVISIFPTSRPSLTGENWFVTNNLRQQTFRQIYVFTTAGSIPHGVNVAFIGGFTAIYGTFTDGTNWYPLPYVDVTAANNQVNVIITPTNIIITSGGGAPPSIVNGFVVLEWLSNP